MKQLSKPPNKRVCQKKSQGMDSKRAHASIAGGNSITWLIAAEMVKPGRANLLVYTAHTRSRLIHLGLFPHKGEGGRKPN